MTKKAAMAQAKQESCLVEARYGHQYGNTSGGEYLALQAWCVEHGEHEIGPICEGPHWKPASHLARWRRNRVLHLLYGSPVPPCLAKLRAEVEEEYRLRERFNAAVRGVDWILFAVDDGDSIDALLGKGQLDDLLSALKAKREQEVNA